MVNNILICFLYVISDQSAIPAREYVYVAFFTLLTNISEKSIVFLQQGTLEVYKLPTV